MATSDFPPKDPLRSTQRGTTPPSGEHARPTPPAMPAVRDLERGTPVPIDLERLVQKMLGALGPTGAAERHYREILVEGIVAKMGPDDQDARVDAGSEQPIEDLE